MQHQEIAQRFARGYELINGLDLTANVAAVKLI